MPSEAVGMGPGAVIDKRYELISMIGRGGFGDVWKARQFTTGQLVAIKIARAVDEQSGSGIAARFKREMAVVAELSHPNIVRLIDSGQLPDRRLYAVLQLVRGVSLQELLQREGPLAPTEAKHLMLQVLDALCSAHDLGVIHRDLKPANIMVTSVGARRNAMVLDFGIATFTKGALASSLQNITPDDTVGGTPAYMAPEQLHGKEPNPQTDIYAWGLVFLESLTSQRVVRGNTIAETMFAHLRPEPHQLPPTMAAHRLGRVLRSAVSKDPTSRYADARDALAQLAPCDVSTLRQLHRIEAPVNPEGDTAAMATVDPDGEYIEIDTATGRRVLMPAVKTEARTYNMAEAGVQSDSFTTPSRNLVERRQLTAMVCEFGPLALLSEILAPDELYQLMGQFRRICEAAVARLEGVIDRVESTRVISYFGFPIAHEDDAGRAIQAAVEIIQRVCEGEIDIPLHGMDEFARANDGAELALNVHAGVHTGLVITSSVHLATTGGVSIVSDVDRLAGRLQEAAGYGNILITEDVYKLVRDRFECVAEGMREFGTYGALAVYRALGLADAVTPTEIPPDRPSIGRSSELSTLIDRWDEVDDGRGQVVMVTGEAGIGKSHIARVFQRMIRDSTHFWLDCPSSPYLVGSALHPITHALRILFGLARNDSTAVRRRKVGDFLRKHRIDRERFESFMVAFLDLEESGDGENPAPAVFRQSAEEQLIDFLFALSESRPVVACLEDLHWADPSTQEFTHNLVDQVPLAPILVLTTTRPSYLPDWRDRTHVIRMPLSRLSRKRVETMVRAVAGSKRLPEELVAHLADKTDGVPLFVEELTKAVLESNQVIELEDRYELDGDLSSLAIPATLRGSLMARLDRLGSAKEVAQIAAIAGRQFTFRLIDSICDISTVELGRALGQLVNSELVIQRGRPPSSRYIFKHALVQDTAYESLLEKTRRHYHARIGDTLETDFPDYTQLHPELLAHHYSEARLDRKAIDYWLRAGRRASERSAHVECIQQLRRALELIERLPQEGDGVERDKLELTVLMALGPPLMATSGYGTLAVEENYSRARDLCRELKYDRDMFSALWGMWASTQVQGRYDDALAFAERLFGLAERLDEEELYLAAHAAWGASLTITGEYRRALDHFERGIDIYELDRHRHLAHIYSLDPGMYCHVFRGWVLYAQGYPDRAAQSAERGIEIARQLDHPNSQGFALCMSLKIFQARGDLARVIELAEAGMELGIEYRLMHWLPFAEFLHGWVLAERAESEKSRQEGIAEMREGLAEWSARAGTALAYFHSLLAEQLGRLGRVEDALELQSRALPAGPDHKGHYYEAIWQGVRAQLLIMRGQPGDLEQAETVLAETIAGAKKRGERMAELDALMDAIELARCLDKPYQEQLDRLAELCQSIDEGAELPNMKRARDLLAQ
ncbi:MAG: protein kinase [Proteobacteria bacterium]|nr:protein kinase [Pseudomonadota bacterium]